MKVRICIIVMLLMCFASVGFAKQFTDNEYGYTITIPDAWNDVPIHNDGTSTTEHYDRYMCRYLDNEGHKARALVITVIPSVTEREVSNLYVESKYNFSDFLELYSNRMKNYVKYAERHNFRLRWTNSNIKIEKLPNNIWCICTMIDAETTSTNKVIFAGTIINSNFIQLVIAYRGDEENVETVFQQIMESVKPL